MWVQPVPGTFHSPLIGVARTPAGLTGPGTVTATAEGLVVEGRRVSSTLVSLFGLFGLVPGFMIAGLVASVSNYIAGGAVLACVFGGAAFGRWLGGRKPYRATIPWSAISDASVFGSKLEFLSKYKPKGTVEFHAEAGREHELRSAVASVLPPLVGR